MMQLGVVFFEFFWVGTFLIFFALLAEDFLSKLIAFGY
jgi:hypothetical protein